MWHIHELFYCIRCKNAFRPIEFGLFGTSGLSWWASSSLLYFCLVFYCPPSSCYKYFFDIPKYHCLFLFHLVTPLTAKITEYQIITNPNYLSLMLMVTCYWITDLYDKLESWNLSVIYAVSLFMLISSKGLQVSATDWFPCCYWFRSNKVQTLPIYWTRHVL